MTLGGGNLVHYIAKGLSMAYVRHQKI